MILQLQHPELQDFEPVLRGYANIAHTTGIDALSAAGRKLMEIKENEGLHRKFIRSCHYGFDLAQRHVGSHLIGLEERISALEREVRRMRHAREPGIRSQIELIK